MEKLLFIFCLCFSWLPAVQAQSTPAGQDSTLQVTESSDTLFSKTVFASDTLQTAALQTTDSIVQAKEIYPIKPLGFAIPVATILYGATIVGHSGLYSSYSIRRDIQTLAPDFETPLDDYMQYVPMVAAYATGFIPGTKPRHSNGRRLWMFVQAQVFTSLAVATLKYYTHELRPDGSDYFSFPSGHATQAFMGAALFDMEYPRQMKGVKIGLYTLAGLTGALAMMNDRHWASDVVFGAGLGMLSVRLLYWSEKFNKNRKTQR